MSHRLGAFYAVIAFSSWGLLPLYWKKLQEIPSLEILCHRIIWSLVFLSFWFVFQPKLRKEISSWSKATFAWLGLSSLILGGNWFLFIWAINHNHVLESSLGYFMNPIVNIVLGFIFLKERLSRKQTLAVGLAFLGVLNLTFQIRQFPWIALLLALQFGSYGLLRKISHAPALAGLWFETLLLTFPALTYLLFLNQNQTGFFGNQSWVTDLFLIGAGPITSLPLLWFIQAARNLRLSTLGFFQYLSPTGQFLLAIFLYQEPFLQAHQITFACIWIAIGIYSYDSWTRYVFKRFKA